jgi:hypothetical protein
MPAANVPKRIEAQDRRRMEEETTRRDPMTEEMYEMDMMNLTEEQIEELHNRLGLILNLMDQTRKRVGKVSPRTIKNDLKKIEERLANLFYETT